MLDIIILAAGKGTRMKSDLPKVLHTIGGRPMLSHVINSAANLGESQMMVVIGHGCEQIERSFSENDQLVFVHQEQQLGTGHAVQQTLSFLSENSSALILYGDVPLVKETTLKRLLSRVDENTLALLTVDLPDPSGYGRIIRDSSGSVTAIVEQKDASREQLQIQEVNTGILAVNSTYLQKWLPLLSNDNAQREYYLTDIIALAVAGGLHIVCEQPDADWEVQGINNRQQQAELERIYQRNQADELMAKGITLLDPGRFDCRGELHCGADVVVDVNVLFEGHNTLGNAVSIGPNCIIKDAIIGDGTVIKANSVIESTIIGKSCDIGPFARLRPGTELADQAKIGNFVETKKTIIGEGSKVNHLSYIGDANLGSGVNIGAGTITCNYDGANKHLTKIGDRAFIGSNTALVAPVTIGDGSTVGAGSTITREVDDNTLALTRAPQRILADWQRPTKKES